MQYSEFNSFKYELINYMNSKLSEWSSLYGVNRPELHIVDDALLDPWFPIAVYVPSGVRHSGVEGPAIIINEEFIRDLYGKALESGRFDLLYKIVTWLLAHEFGHHVGYVRSSILYRIPIHMLREGTKRIEISASIYANRLTGISRPDYVKSFYVLMGIPYMSYITMRIIKYRAREIIGRP